MWNMLQNVPSDSVILHQHISVTPVTIIWAAYDKNTVNIQIIVQKYMTKPLCSTFDLQIKCHIIHFLTIFCMLIVFLL